MLRFLAALTATLALTATGAASAAPRPPALPEFTGAIHGHSSYSDGYPGSYPRTYYKAAREHGLDFFAGTEHSDNLDAPFVASEYCFDADTSDAAACAVADQENPPDSFRKWSAALEQADAASTSTFTGIRGFEWTSDRFGHINVLSSANQVNAKVDGGYADLRTFYGWLSRPVGLGGGSDGIAVFNHPGAKKLSTRDPAYNWNDFAYEPAVDDQMVGIEVFNDGGDFASPGEEGAGPDGWYARALDKGWHVGAVGAEDLGHVKGDDWGGPGEPKTVIAAADRSRGALEAGLRARRSYAIRRAGYALTFTADGAPMGSRLERATGERVRLRATAGAREGAITPGRRLEIDLVSSGGGVVATAKDGTLDVSRRAVDGERWYFVRVRETGPGGGEAVAFSSPVWVTARPSGGASSGQWLAGDFHAHTCFSRDVYCGPSDEPLAYEPAEAEADVRQALVDAELQNGGQDLAEGIGEAGGQLATYGLDVGGRFAEASARGLDFLTISDHEDVRSSQDPSFGSAGVVGLPAYENSLEGHAQMLGATRVYDRANVPRMAADLRADGGLLQANHPGYRISEPFSSCDDPSLRHWKYGAEVPLDTVEVWNPTSSVAAGEAYLECRLQRGERVAATGGGDSHWASLTAAGAGVGAPSTWVFASDRSSTGILRAVREGRTSISKRPPGEGGAALLLEADADRDGRFEATQGDVVPGGTPMRVRSASPSTTGFARIRANGQTVTLPDARLAPGGVVAFTAPMGSGWVRADLLAAPAGTADAAPCPGRGSSVSTCTYDQLVLAMTSPLYLERGRGG